MFLLRCKERLYHNFLLTLCFLDIPQSSCFEKLKMHFRGINHKHSCMFLGSVQFIILKGFLKIFKMRLNWGWIKKLFWIDLFYVSTWSKIPSTDIVPRGKWMKLPCYTLNHVLVRYFGHQNCQNFNINLIFFASRDIVCRRNIEAKVSVKKLTMFVFER